MSNNHNRQTLTHPSPLIPLDLYTLILAFSPQGRRAGKRRERKMEKELLFNIMPDF
jgi:hypothetical protein